MRLVSAGEAGGSGADVFGSAGAKYEIVTNPVAVFARFCCKRGECA